MLSSFVYMQITQMINTCTILLSTKKMVLILFMRYSGVETYQRRIDRKNLKIKSLSLIAFLFFLRNSLIACYINNLCVLFIYQIELIRHN